MCAGGALEGAGTRDVRLAFQINWRPRETRGVLNNGRKRRTGGVRGEQRQTVDGASGLALAGERHGVDKGLECVLGGAEARR